MRERDRQRASFVVVSIQCLQSLLEYPVGINSPHKINKIPFAAVENSLLQSVEKCWKSTENDRNGLNNLVFLIIYCLHLLATALIVLALIYPTFVCLQGIQKLS